MNTKLIAASLIIFSTAIAGPAFARGGSSGGGVGPAGPVGYSWLNTPQGQSVQSAAAERQGDRNANAAYGGSSSTTSRSGARSSVSESVNEGH
jgi:hypothetical protein